MATITIKRQELAERFKVQMLAKEKELIGIGLPRYWYYTLFVMYELLELIEDEVYELDDEQVEQFSKYTLLELAEKIIDIERTPVYMLAIDMINDELDELRKGE